MTNYDKEYDDTNKGVIWKNEKRDEKSPDFSGDLNVDGKEYKIFARRVEKTKPTSPVLRLSIVAKDSYQNKQQPTPNLNEDFEDVQF